MRISVAQGQSKRGLVLGILGLFVLAVVSLPLIPYATAQKDSTITVPNPGTELWRDFRGAVEGRTQVRGVDSGIVISDSGEAWRNYRVAELVPISGLILSAILALFLLYYLIRGTIRIGAGRSGRVIKRFTTYEIGVHWFVAVTFVILAFSGLVLLYGRWVLIPILGPQGFGATAAAMKAAHNYVGILFVIAVPLMAITFLKDSLFKLKTDLIWFLRAGGYLGGKHPKAGKVNAGQKAWYWTAVMAGLVLVGSGLVLNFPNFQQGRELMQQSHLLHTVASVVVIGFFFVHLYLSTVGVEGALDAMTSGYVDENWVKQHHELWYDEVRNTAVPESQIKKAGGEGAQPETT